MKGGSAGVVLKLLALVCVLIGVVMIVATWFFFKRPLTMDRWVSRFALGSAGLERHQAEGPAGQLTWFSGGDGETTLVLLHGAGDQAGTWARVMTPLVEKYRVVVPDLAGHGQSDPKKGPISVGSVVEGVEAVLDAEVGSAPVTIVGNSLGGWAAFLVALDRPRQVERIVAVNGGPIRQENPAVNIFPATREEARRTMEGLMGPVADSIPDMVLDDIVREAPTGPAARVAATADDMDPYLLDARLGEVTTPVDLLWGEADELLPVAYAERLQEGLNTVRLTTIPNCGHVPQRECPVVFFETLIKLLDEGPPQPRPSAETAGDETKPSPPGEASP